MVSGPNEIPELKIQTPLVAPTARRIPTEPALKAIPEPTSLVQAPDTVQFSPQAQAASRVSAVAQATPEVRPERVQEAVAKLQAQAPNSAALNAQLAEKLLTEN